MGGIFGSKPKSKQSSQNLAYPSLSSTFSPLYGAATTGVDAMRRFLLGDASGLESYKDATGFDALAQEGSEGILGNAAARGILRSGSTGKALQRFGSTLSNQFAGNYLDQLGKLAGLGLGAGSLVSGAGNVSSGTSSGGGKSGLGNALGTALTVASVASDRRLKKNIVKIGEYEDGLGIYQYHYISGAGPYIGVMAQEVAELRPYALGPEVDGYMTVNYNNLELVGEDA